LEDEEKHARDEDKTISEKAISPGTSASSSQNLPKMVNYTV
jgi:hypothetical protein